jgi:hypothetical protein
MVRTESLRIQSARHRVDHGTISGRIALIRDTPSHYSPVLIAPFVNLGRRRDGAEIFFWTADGGREVGNLGRHGKSLSEEIRGELQRPLQAD